MIPKSIPRQTADLPVILMCVVSAMCEDEIGINTPF